MRRSLPRPAVLVCSMALTLTGCSNLDHQLGAAATAKGTAQARAVLPPLPDDCRRKQPHAAVREGEEARSALRRERSALDNANARVGRCAAFYDDVSDRLK